VYGGGVLLTRLLCVAWIEPKVCHASDPLIYAALLWSAHARVSTDAMCYHVLLGTVHGVAKSVFHRWATRVVKQARDREAGCVSADWHVVKAMADCLRHNAHPASIQNLSVVSTTKVLSPFVCFYVSDGIINKSNKTHSPWQRSEVLDLWYQLCECAQMHKAQAQELELAKQVNIYAICASDEISLFNQRREFEDS